MASARLRLDFSGPSLPVPARQRLPPGLAARGLGSEAITARCIPWSGDARLRLTIALDHRGTSTVVASNAQGAELGQVPVRCGGQFQPFDIPLSAVPAELQLHVLGDPLWIANGGDDWDELAPCLRRDHTDSVRDAARSRLASAACIQQFGWKDGCITDALVDLHRATGNERFLNALRRRMALFVPDGRLRYDDHLSEPREDRFYGIEGGLPVAALLDLPGGQRLGQRLRDFWTNERTQADGTISDGAHLSTEGCYVIAWPMALMARRAGDAALARQALHQLRVRRDRLVVGGSLWQSRTGSEAGHLAGWARGVAWYLLGWVRTLGAVDGLVPWDDDLREECRRVARWACDLQRADGQWGNFLDDPTSAVDTSGSAGIAAALARGAALGLLDGSAHDAARRCAEGLDACLTADGWLTGCAPENKGGEALQRSSYRVIAPFGLGLWGQLTAALLHPTLVRQP